MSRAFVSSVLGVTFLSGLAIGAVGNQYLTDTKAVVAAKNQAVVELREATIDSRVKRYHREGDEHFLELENGDRVDLYRPMGGPQSVADNYFVGNYFGTTEFAVTDSGNYVEISRFGSDRVHRTAETFLGEVDVTANLRAVVETKLHEDAKFQRVCDPDENSRRIWSCEPYLDLLKVELTTDWPGQKQEYTTLGGRE